VAKTRRGSRKTSASRAKSSKKTSRKPARKSAAPKSKTLSSQRKQVAPEGLDLKKLRSDITKANDVLQKRLQKIDPESPQGKKLAETQLKITQWSFDIDGICSSDPGAEPCGTGMVIS
jgi:hypothetical protein